MSKRDNSRKNSFINNLPQNLIIDCIDKFTGKINFNFGFFDNSQNAGQDFIDWNQKQLVELLVKLKEYSKESVEYWKKKRIGSKSGTVLEVYGKFPANSDFTVPKHIPLDVEWSRFRLEGAVRLIGFIIDRKVCEDINLQPNTFYVVFLDKNHKFWKIS